MPFQKRGKFYYHKGKKYTKKQVMAYYATGGFKRPPRKGRLASKKSSKKTSRKK